MTWQRFTPRSRDTISDLGWELSGRFFSGSSVLFCKKTSMIILGCTYEPHHEKTYLRGLGQFVCLICGFTSQSTTMDMSRRSVNLTILFLGSPSTQTLRSRSKTLNGDVLFLPVLSVRPSQNRFRSVTWKPFKVSSWNFIQILINIRRRAEHKNHNSCIFTFWVMPLWTLSITKLFPLCNLKTVRGISRNFIQILTHISRHAERKNRNLYLYFLSYAPLNLVHHKIVSAL